MDARITSTSSTVTTLPVDLSVNKRKRGLSLEDEKITEENNKNIEEHLRRYMLRMKQRHEQVIKEEEARYQRIKYAMHAKYIIKLERNAAIRHAIQKRARLEEAAAARKREEQQKSVLRRTVKDQKTKWSADKRRLDERQVDMGSSTRTPFIQGVSSQVEAVPDTMVVEPIPVASETLTEEELIEHQQRQLWRAICQSQIPKAYRLLNQSIIIRASNCRKLAIACHRESRRALLRTRMTRDLPVRARRAMREMLVFWKRNEKEEREQRRKAEKAALEKLRQEEEEREARRQQRKLNFLITQTELYSHFIGGKVMAGRDDEGEATMPSVNGGPSAMDLDLTSGQEGLQVSGPLDFDNDDDAKIQAQARLNAQAALERQQQQTRQFDTLAKEKRAAGGFATSETKVSQKDLDEMDFLNPSGMSTATEVQQPQMLHCELKKYQLKGLQWLANLYDQGINGILADEMGLGKTVQSIALMAHLAETHNLWGPFLVVGPAVTLHNWHQEISRFVPDFKVLPYWGTVSERKVLRKSWSKLYTREAPFHVLVTSYQIVVADQSYFQKIKWQYMILDEAQAIKSSSSTRWKTLLKFNTRNRLLLTGTPIQNNMQELWALLHFIMPTLFDSHDEFSDWFSKDIESHAENKGSLNEHQLRRLHMILKPFMLRRVKKNVQHELGDKIEIEIPCTLSARQRHMYRNLREKISLAELLRKVESNGDSDGNVDSLMNLVMQFRKVCNHPELFERAEATFPFACCRFGMTNSLVREGDVLTCNYSVRGVIAQTLPKLCYRDGGYRWAHRGGHADTGDTKYLDRLMNIWRKDYIHESSWEEQGAFGFLKIVDVSPSEASTSFYGNVVDRWSVAADIRKRASRRVLRSADVAANEHLDAYRASLHSTRALDPTPTLTALEHVSTDLALDTLVCISQCYYPRVVAAPIEFVCSDRSFAYEQEDLMLATPLMSKIRTIAGTGAYVYRSEELLIDEAPHITTDTHLMRGNSPIHVPPLSRLVLDSGKLARLDKLLAELKAGGHRVLIYFQMTRMIDLMEEYLAYRRYTYLRLDGSSKIEDRRDMVTDWQTKEDIFIFLLSTRAGGLGINLTAADTVIFYDSDWNPTVDQQAMDRAHRLGQTRQVTVYRLITTGTIEERILNRAKQKDEIQKVVIAGGDFRPVELKSREIVSLLMDDE